MKLLNHVKQHRARLDLTQQDLAERVGVRRQTILAIEKGHFIPSALLAFLIARELGMRVDEVFQIDSQIDSQIASEIASESPDEQENTP